MGRCGEGYHVQKDTLQEMDKLTIWLVLGPFGSRNEYRVMFFLHKNPCIYVYITTIKLVECQFLMENTWNDNMVILSLKLQCRKYLSKPLRSFFLKDGNDLKIFEFSKVDD